MFLNDGKLVLSLFIILFKFSLFNFYSYVSVCSGFLVVWYLVKWSLHFPKFAVHFGGAVFVHLYLMRQVLSLLSCSLFLFWCISSISN